MMVPDRQSLDVLLMGHSHFHWLNEFVRKDVEPRYRDFAVSLNGCRAVSFYTKRGGRVADFAPRHATEKIRKLLPDIVILCIGGNDIDSRDVNHKPQAVGMKVFQLASSLIRIGVNQVGVCQVLPRKKWRKLLRGEGDRAVEIINEFLHAACENHPNIFFWKHVSWKNSREFLREDGVHLTVAGNKKLFRSVRGAILMAAKRCSK